MQKQNQKCFPYNTEVCSMKESFPELPNRFPPYYLCQNGKRNTMNDILDKRKESFVRNCHIVNRGENIGYEISPSALWRLPQAAKDTFFEFTKKEVLTPDVVNLSGTGDKFYGYARNVDVESELYRINYLNDKCFDSEYKINPNQNNTSLYRYKDILNNPTGLFNFNFQEKCYEKNNNNDMNHNMDSNKASNMNPSLEQYLKAQDNTYRDIKLKPLKCLDGPLTNSDKISGFSQPNNDNYFLVGDGFDNKSGACYPPEKTWNNVTKRKMIYHRQFDN
jgi:hypothetical protein